MKKSIVTTLVLTLFLSLLMGITAFADKFQVVKTVADISKFTKITDQNDPKGFVYAFNADFDSKAELATVDGKKLVKITANGGAYNYFHSRLGIAADGDISTGTPDGMRIYVKTEVPFTISLRFDIVEGEVAQKFLFFNIYLTDTKGERVEFEYTEDCHATVPAKFEGYIVLPFDKEYQTLEGDECTRTGAEMKGLYQILFDLDPVDAETFEGDIIYFGNMETVKIQKILKTSAPATATKAPTATANVTASAVTTTDATATAETTTEAITTTAAGTTVTTPATTSAAPVVNKTSNGWILPVIIALVVIGAGVTAFIMIKKRKNA